MKKVLVLGATGGTGQHVVAQALERGHEVTAYVRSPDRLKTTSLRLRVVTGAIEDEAALTHATRGQDVVVSALGRGRSLKSDGLISRAIPAIVRAMEAAGVRRLIVTSAYGVGETYRDVPAFPRLLMRTLLADLYRDKAAAEAALRRSALDWTLVYPTALTDDPRRGRYRSGERLALRGVPRVSRADVADLLVSQIDDDRYIRKGILVSD